MRLFEIFTHCVFVKASLIRRVGQNDLKVEEKGVKLHKAVFPVLVSIRDPYHKYNNPHNYKEIEKGHFGAQPAHTSRFSAFFRPRREIISIVLLTNALFLEESSTTTQNFQKLHKSFWLCQHPVAFFRDATVGWSMKYSTKLSQTYLKKICFFLNCNLKKWEKRNCDELFQRR